MKYISILTLILLIFSCSDSSSNQDVSEVVEDDFNPDQEVIEYNNPPAEGFDIEGSDAIAIILADKVMQAMGGRQSWDSTKYLSWNFFGARKLLWDKSTGNVRIENMSDDRIVLVNVNTMEGRVFKDGMEMTDTDSISYYLDWGKNVWINDSYWLIMPFKLKDSGVTLTYLGDSQTLVGEKSERLELTFKDVGVTPQNRYNVWVSNETNLVCQWSYYRTATDSIPGFILPWGNYFEAGGILLSDDRGERDLSDVEVLTDVPENMFTSFEVSI